jgi:phosphate transport system permease protein
VTTTVIPARSERPRRKVRRKGGVSLQAQGEPMVWLTGGALGLALAMIVGLLVLVAGQALPAFWPRDVIRIETRDGRAIAGEVTVEEEFRPDPGAIDALPEQAREAARRALDEHGGRSRRRLLRTGNYDLTGTHFTWVGDLEIASESRPEWMLVVERRSWGRFYGEPASITIHGRTLVGEPERVWDMFTSKLGEARKTFEERRALEMDETGRVHRRIEDARLALREVELAHGRGSEEWTRAEARTNEITDAAHREFEELQKRIAELRERAAGYSMVLESASGERKEVLLEEIVRAYPPNRSSLGDKLDVEVSRIAEFLLDEPREANSEGGVFPAIFGTVLMTFVMTVLVVPFGVLAALYLREYAKPGWIVGAVRIAINNLAGVPSIVFGVFGLGFFCYLVGGTVDQVLFAERLPAPTFGKGGLLWASLTLALLTLPVVIVPTEEALAAVPRSMREGSFACGATRWQTIRRIVLPRAMPGILTGAILAIARGAGEVAPLMLVGAVKLAPDLPLDGAWPFLHPERSFMHLGFHVYDLGFQSQNSEAAKPMVFATTLLLVGLVVVLNLIAIWARARLRRRFQGAQL